MKGRGAIRVGTAGWTDPTLVKCGRFYPKGATTPEARLRHYASLFSLVEVDSTFYGIPPADRVAAWVDRTPEGFVFDVKAHAFMTGHPGEVRGLPRVLVDALPEGLREGRVHPRDLPAPALDEVFALFRASLSPLVDAGKLGRVLLQFPPWLDASPANANLVARTARATGLPAMVELRNATWLAPETRERTRSFLQRAGLPFVSVDMPQGFASSLPPIAVVTSSDMAAVRFHGRNAEAWEAKHETAATRFRYLYGDDELDAWVDRIREMAEDAAEVHVVMNNCFEDHAVKNALRMKELLAR